jgi:hypothetical protein
MLPPCNTSRPSAPHRPPHHALGLARRASARAFGTPISFIQLHKRCTKRLPIKLDGRLLQYPYGISLFPLALNTWAFNSFIITINGPRPIYLTVVTSRISRSAGAQSFGGAHSGRVCVRVFIGVSVRVCCERLRCTASI